MRPLHEENGSPSVSMIRAFFVLFSRVVSRTQNRPASKYSRCRIGLPSVLRQRLEHPKIPPQCRGPLTTTPFVCENLRADPRNLIRSRTPVRSPSASSHTTPFATTVPRRNTSDRSDLRVFPPQGVRPMAVVNSSNVVLLRESREAP